MSGHADRHDLRRSMRRVDGWFTLGLVALTCATLAWSLDDAMLVLGRDGVTDFLFWAAIGGVLVGFVGPVVGWGRWTTHALGAGFAALLVPLLVGGVLVPGGASPGGLFLATTNAVVGAWSDLVLAERLSTVQYGHHLLVLGLIVWGTSQFASFAAFAHRRPINAVVVVGLLLIANMSLTVRDQLPFLVIFSVAALLLLVRFHTLDEQADWARRRIGDPSALSALYLRGGTVFIIAVISGSLLLTGAAASAPLAGAWSDVGARFIEWGQFLERFLPPSRTGRSIGPSFGDTARIGTVWATSDDLFMQVDFEPTEIERPYLTAAVYDRYELGGWTRSQDVPVTRDPGAEILAGTADEIDKTARRPLVATFTPEVARREVFLPGLPSTVGQAVYVRLVGEGGYLGAVEREPSDASYTVTTLIPADEKSGGPTEARLRAAGTDYPPGILAMYGRDTLPEGALGPLSRALLGEIVASARSSSPYDLADRIREVLLDHNEFRYDTDLTEEPCTDASIVECFVDIRAGFCEYYASTMTVFLRELGIPARFVEGFLPGEPNAGGTGAAIRVNQAHAWVQAYFPGYGWIEFDPTGGPTGPQLAPIPSGVPVASGSPRPSGSGTGGELIPPIRGIDEIPRGGATLGGPRGDGPAGPLIALALLLGVVVAAIAAAAWQRGPRGPVSAEDTYGSVARLAGRLGFGQRPNQTVYEYAGALADELPMVRPELETVAHAKVEVAYGGQRLGEDRLAGLREAHRRLRVNLLRLVLRRRGRRGIRGR